MYDKLWEESPMLQEMRAESRAEGEIQALQRALVTVVKTRFPELTELAREQVTHVKNPTVLDVLLQGISAAPEESVARWVLTSLAA